MTTNWRWVLAAVTVSALAGLAGVVAGAGPAFSSQAIEDDGLSIDDAKLAEVREYLEEQRSRFGWPAMTAGLVLGDEVALLETFGDANVAVDTPFLIASLSKSITALAVVQLVDDGLVDLDAPVTDYLPELAPGGQTVTIRDLMHHRSGLTTRAGIEPFAGGLGADLETNVGRLGTFLEGGAPFEYSNANYDTLALVVERVAGVDFADYIQDQVFTALDMTDSYLDPDVAQQSGLAAGHYHWLFAGFRPDVPTMPLGLAGSHTMFSSAEDLTHLLIANLNNGNYRGTAVVSEEALQVLHEPRPIDTDSLYGYVGGLRALPPGSLATTGPLAGSAYMWHDGGSPSYRSHVWMVPEAGVGFVVLVNANDLTDESFLPQVSDNVAFMLFGLDPFEVRGLSDFLTRWSKHILFVVAAGQILLAALSIPVLRNLRGGRRPEAAGWVILSAATLLDIVALVLIVAVIPSVSDAPWAVVLDQPDYRILVIAMGIGILWGIVRTTLAIRYTTRADRTARPTPTTV